MLRSLRPPCPGTDPSVLARPLFLASQTEFSQEKYVRKKQKKHLARCIVRRPTARTIAECYFAKDPRRIHNLRVDTLSQMLSAANVQAHGRVLVLDHCGGLVTGAVMERMGGLGSVVFAHPGPSIPGCDILHRFNLPDEHYEALRSVSLQRLLSGQQAGTSGAAAPNAAAPAVVEGGPPVAAAVEGEGEPPAVAKAAGRAKRGKLTRATDEEVARFRQEGELVAPLLSCAPSFAW